MWIEQTPEGVEIWHYSAEELAAWRDEITRKHSRYETADEFIAAYHRRELEDGDFHVDRLVFELGIGRACHVAA